MRIKNRNLKLTSKIHSIYGGISLTLGILSLVLFFKAVKSSAFGDRDLLTIRYQIGIYEIIAFMLCLIGLLYAWIAEKQEDDFKLFAHFGLAVNLIALVLHIMVISSAF